MKLRIHAVTLRDNEVRELETTGKVIDTPGLQVADIESDHYVAIYRQIESSRSPLFIVRDGATLTPMYRHDNAWHKIYMDPVELDHLQWPKLTKDVDLRSLDGLRAFRKSVPVPQF